MVTGKIYSWKKYGHISEGGNISHVTGKLWQGDESYPKPLFLLFCYKFPCYSYI